MTVLQCYVCTASSEDGGDDVHPIQGALTLGGGRWKFGYNPSNSSVEASWWPSFSPSVLDDGVLGAVKDGGGNPMSVVSFRLRNAYSCSGPVGVCVFEGRIHISQMGMTGETTFEKTIDELKLKDYLVFEFEGTGPPVGEPSGSPGALEDSRTKIIQLQHQTDVLGKEKGLADADVRVLQDKARRHEAELDKMKASWESDVASHQASVVKEKEVSREALAKVQADLKAKTADLEEARTTHGTQIKDIKALHEADMSAQRVTFEEEKRACEASRLETEKQLRVKQSELAQANARYKTELETIQARHDAIVSAQRERSAGITRATSASRGVVENELRAKKEELARAESRHEASMSSIRAGFAREKEVLEANLRDKTSELAQIRRVTGVENRRLERDNASLRESVGKLETMASMQAAKTREAERTLARSEDGSARVGQMVKTAMADLSCWVPDSPPPPYHKTDPYSTANEVQERVRQLVLLLKKTRGGLDEAMGRLKTTQELRGKDEAEIRSLRERIRELEGRSRGRGKEKRSSFWDGSDDDGCFDEEECVDGNHGLTFRFHIGSRSRW